MTDKMESESLTHEASLVLARKLLDDVETHNKTTNALLLAYDSERETFQMLAINADMAEVRALLLGCVAAMQTTLDEIAKPRTVN